MKRSFALLLTAALVCTLTACGRKNNDKTPNDPPTTNQSMTQTPAETPDTAPGGTVMQDWGSDTVTPDQTPAADAEKPDSAPGVSYEQMLRNGRIHDRDGLLHDGENAGTDITRSVGDAARDLVRGGQQAVRDMVR